MRHAWMLLALAACGPVSEAPGFVAATVVSEGLASGTVQSMDVFLVEPQTTAGAPLDCAALRTAPLTTRTDLVSHWHKFLAFGAARVDGMIPGNTLILAIDGYATTDGTGARIATACREGVTITAGKTTDVSVVLAAP